MGHGFSKWFKQSMLGEEEAASEQEGQGAGNPYTKNIFPNPPTPQRPYGTPEYAKTKASSSISPFDSSVNRYAQEGSLDPPHF
jgi:hypothetical protein|tara:strand:- start:72 stop:320 length:249 start_codon:yes stop_codon:yes gene_type:complete